MPAQKLELALAFLQSHPDAAAAILEHQAAEDVANLFQDIPHRIGARVLERMLPQYTARLCKLMPADHCAAMLAMMNYSIVAAILRFSSTDHRKQLLNLLPEKIRIACLLILNYPEDTVGAWMICQAASVPDDISVEQALNTLLAQDDLVLIETIFVVDRDRVLLGELSYAALLRAPPETAITSLLALKIPVILARMKLESAITLEIWEHRDAVPIVNRQGHFVGVLRHVDLRRGIAQVANVIEAPSGSDPITSLLSVYGSSLFSLLDTVGDFASNKNH